MTIRFAPLVFSAGLATAIAAPGCHSDPAVKIANVIPIADARISRDGQLVNARIDGGAALLAFDYNGSPVTVNLDGSQSYDPDGTIVTYRWLSATRVPDAGAEGGAMAPDDSGIVNQRWVPPGQPPNWPGDVESPQVQLGEGAWSFTLWVVDNEGAISNPDTITITIGNVVSPVVQACADAVVTTESQSCRQCVCNQGDMCRAAVVSTACDQTCWGLVNCVAANCPDFAAMQAKGDYSCLTANCMAYIAGATPAGAVAPCFNMCTSQCAGDGGAGGGADGGSGEGGGGAAGGSGEGGGG